MPLHPSLRAKYRLQTDRDAAIAENLFATARQPGWNISEATIDRVLSYYGVVLVPLFDAGRISTADAALGLLAEFASQQGIDEKEQQDLADWYMGMARHLETHAGEPPVLSQPSRVALQAELAELEKKARADQVWYWGSKEAQMRMYELLALLEGGEENSPAAKRVEAADQNSRMALIENMMGDPRSDYWRGSESSILQEEYAQLVDQSQPAADTSDAT
ncbi:MAG: hypothetical protein PSV22_03595 [Pseudolabrys sp.]|nr:hypothetical protein [Pseudolabrys sp.]